MDGFVSGFVCAIDMVVLGNARPLLLSPGDTGVSHTHPVLAGLPVPAGHLRSADHRHGRLSITVTTSGGANVPEPAFRMNYLNPALVMVQSNRQKTFNMAE